MQPIWPLPNLMMEIPQGSEHPGSFGARRKFDIHTGIDLYAPIGQAVVAIENGTVVAIDPAFTGGDDSPKNAAGEPIWLLTEAIMIEGVSGIVLYGEIAVDKNLAIGSTVQAGDVLGTVLPVLRPKPNGEPFKNPANSASMLHVELYKPAARKGEFWQLDEPKPALLLDPTDLLLAAKAASK